MFLMDLCTVGHVCFAKEDEIALLFSLEQDGSYKIFPLKQCRSWDFVFLDGLGRANPFVFEADVLLIDRQLFFWCDTPRALKGRRLLA